MSINTSNTISNPSNIEEDDFAINLNIIDTNQVFITNQVFTTN